MVVASSRLVNNADFSPDGRRITFQSDRSRSTEIWVCDSDGTHLRQLTSFGHGHTGSPRWSPDGSRIAFDSTVEGQAQVYVIPSNGGPPKRLTEPPSAIPNWSHDSQWIYFASARAGKDEIWKVAASGGSSTQVTTHGGMFAAESPDGRSLYYLTRHGGELWQKPLNGGSDRKVIDSVLHWNFAVTEQGIYYARPGAGSWSARFLNLATGVDTRLAEFTKPAGLGLSVSPDRHTLLYTEIDDQGSDLMLVENFR
jgi:Tol biopolymer transport system component